MRWTSITITKIAHGEHAPAWSRVLGSDEWHGSVRVLKSQPGALVFAATLILHGVSREVVIKRQELRDPWALIKSVIGHGRASRHWNGAALLTSAGIATPKVLLIGRAVIDGVNNEVLVMHRQPGHTLLECMGNRSMSLQSQHAIANAVGKQLAVFMHRGIRNRDHKPSNIMLSESPDQPPTLGVIDCVAITKSNSASRMTRMLASLLIEAIGTNVAPRLALRARTLKTYVDLALNPGGSSSLSAAQLRQARRALWDQVAAHIQRHGDPTPSDPPHAPPGR